MTNSRSAWRWLIASALALALSGCLLPAQRSTLPTSPTPPVTTDDRDSAPSEAIDRAALEALPDPIARSERRASGANRSPYTVLGQSYEVLQSADDYVAEGLASWYGSKFHGRSTSNGEQFDMYQLSAAHKSLPLPAYVRVTNLANGRSTILRVNDRGPFHGDRLIDLSYAAAVKLGFDLQGTAPVRVEMIAPPVNTPLNTPANAAVAAPTRAPPDTRVAIAPGPAGESQPTTAAGAIYLQAGAFRSREAAERLRASLRETLQDVLGRAVVIVLEEGRDAIHRVRIGPLRDDHEADRLQQRLQGSEYGAAVIVRS